MLILYLFVVKFVFTYIFTVCTRTPFRIIGSKPRLQLMMLIYDI